MLKNNRIILNPGQILDFKTHKLIIIALRHNTIT